jgi:hypothetical protein
MRTTMLERFFGDEPTHDPDIRLGRLIGTVLGGALYPMFVWIVIDGLFRVL